MKDNTRKSVFITGGAARVGKHLALSLADQGWTVHLHYRSKSSEAEDVARQIKKGRRL